MEEKLQNPIPVKTQKKEKHIFNTHLLQTSKKLTLLAPPYSHSNKINKGWELEVEFGMRERKRENEFYGSNTKIEYYRRAYAETMRLIPLGYLCLLGLFFFFFFFSFLKGWGKGID